MNELSKYRFILVGSNPILPTKYTIMKWTNENNKQLEQMFNDEVSDPDMAEHFGIGTMALAKQRSRVGLVRWHNRALKRPIIVYSRYKAKPIFALQYTKDGVSHFSNLGSIKQQTAEATAVKLIYCNKIKDVAILKTCSIIRNGSIKRVVVT